MTPGATVQSIYRALLGRDAEAEAAAFYGGQLAAGRPLEDVMAEVLASPECRRRLGVGIPLPVPPGHHHSPICDPALLARVFRDPEQFPVDTPLPGIVLAADRQWRLWQSWRPLLADLPFPDAPEAGSRYYYANPQFGEGDAIVLSCMLRWLKPQRYVEIGSGFSSACALDVVDRYLAGAVRVTCIDPEPTVLRSRLAPGDLDRVAILTDPVQRVDPAIWESLESRDVLFIDSSHVAKAGSDVLAILFEILPRLAMGVAVHFHDVMFPFEYPRSWMVEENRSWNEAYFLRAYLTNNPDFEVLFFNDYFRRLAPELIARTCPTFLRNPGGSLWLRKR